MTSRTQDPPTLPSPRIHLDHRRWWWLLVPVVAAVALFAVLRLAASPASAVKHVTFVNNTVYDVEVDLSGTNGTSTLTLGTAAAHTTTDVQDVIDQGSSWVFHFRAQGTNGGQVRIERAALQGAGWRVTIPNDVAARLGAAGLQPSPTTTG